jgi:hypothetical protein
MLTMKKYPLIGLSVIILSVFVGCAEEEAVLANSTTNMKTTEKPPDSSLNITEAQISSVKNSDGEQVQQIQVSKKFTIEGTFRVPVGVESGPPPTVIKVRDHNGVIHGSVGSWPVLQDDDVYLFSGSIDTIFHPGNYTIEVRVLRQDILSKEVKFVKN